MSYNRTQATQRAVELLGGDTTESDVTSRNILDADGNDYVVFGYTHAAGHEQALAHYFDEQIIAAHTAGECDYPVVLFRRDQSGLLDRVNGD